MEIRRIVYLFAMIIMLTGCSTQNKLSKQFKGKSQAELVLEKGKPTRIEKGENGQMVHIYIKNKLLKAAPINTGQFQYDRFESPKTVKSETYKFFINSSGIIEDVSYELSYAR